MDCGVFLWHDKFKNGLIVLHFIDFFEFTMNKKYDA